jgi:adenosylcobyric acid synthase
MVWGASSGAGKSLLTTALCAWAARARLDVAPFKAQNMSNNARVVPGMDGTAGEIGSAQYFQALAAGVEPHVDMNPVLLKPERDTASQVVVHGCVDASLSRTTWFERSAALAAAARASFDRLAQRHDVLVIEGAGSPAEINLATTDYVNLGTARWARDAGAFRALVVVDIDRGGAFAHLHGTWSLLPADLRSALAGFVLNKFRGDPALLAPGPAILQAATGVPVLGVIPMTRDHGLPEEDGVYTTPIARDGPRIAIVAWPHISNHDEFQPLASSAAVAWARTAADLEQADWIVLPGSKQVSGDLAWLRANGLDAAIARHAARGGSVLGVCGGLQVLGTTLDDPDGVDGEPHGPIAGLGLLPLTTCYAAPKQLRAGTAEFTSLEAPWAALSGRRLSVYEIRCGRTEARDVDARPVLRDPAGAPLGWQRGSVLGIAAHGLFEDAAALAALLGTRARPLQRTFEELADLVEQHLGAQHLHELFCEALA